MGFPNFVELLAVSPQPVLKVKLYCKSRTGPITALKSSGFKRALSQLKSSPRTVLTFQFDFNRKQTALQLEYYSLVSTGLVSLLCPPKTFSLIPIHHI